MTKMAGLLSSFVAPKEECELVRICVLPRDNTILPFQMVLHIVTTSLIVDPSALGPQSQLSFHNQIGGSTKIERFYESRLQVTLE